MRIRTILAAAAAPAIAGAALLATTGAASAAVQQPAWSAYYYNPSGNALGGPQPVGTVSTPSGVHVSLDGGYLAKVTEKMNNANLNGQWITITGHLDQGTAVTYQHPDQYAPPASTARVYFEGSGGGVSDGSPDGYEGQHWWANGEASFDLNMQGTTEFTLTIRATPDGGWSDWNGQSANGSPSMGALFTGAASHVRALGLSFGGGFFFENGVTGTNTPGPDGLIIDSITTSSQAPVSSPAQAG
jgi:hypothetical protein